MKTDKKDKGLTKNSLNESDTTEMNGLRPNDSSDENASDYNVSVFRKSTNPRVIIESDKIDSNCEYRVGNTHKLLGMLCLLVVSIIVLMTFFLSLKTYNKVNEISQYVHTVIDS